MRVIILITTRSVTRTRPDEGWPEQNPLVATSDWDNLLFTLLCPPPPTLNQSPRDCACGCYQCNNLFRLGDSASTRKRNLILPDIEGHITEFTMCLHSSLRTTPSSNHYYTATGLRKMTAPISWTGYIYKWINLHKHPSIHPSIHPYI